MNIVKIHGSIAEQMFQYALYLALTRHTPDTFLDTPAAWLDKRFRLPRFRIATPQQLQHFGKGSLKNRLLASVKRPQGNTLTEPDNRFHSDYLTLDNTYFGGSWLAPAYFSQVADDIAECFFVPTKALPASASHSLSLLAKGETVAVHVHNPLDKANPCTPDYYNWAIANVLSYISHPKFIVMTTDIDWAREHLNFQGAKADFMLYPAEKEISILPYLSRTSHNILAATLTSWWAAWLNRNPDKIVLAPDHWSKTADYPDLYPSSWTTIPTT